MKGETACPGEALKPNGDGIENAFDLSGSSTNHSLIVWQPNDDGGFDVEDDPPIPPAGFGVVSGVVRDATGIPVPNRELEVSSAADITYRAIATTDENGFYAALAPIGVVNVAALDGDTVVAYGSGELLPENIAIEVDVLPMEPTP